jgi:hypothetical protein
MPISLNKTQILVVKKIVISLVIIITALIIPIFAKNIADSYNAQYKKLGNDIRDMKQKLEGLNKRTLEFSDDIKKWEALTENDRKLQGLRINDAKEILEKLQKKYKFNSVKTSFSKPDEINGDYKTETVSMYSSVVSVNFNAISDDMIYGFVAELIHSLPGIVQIKNFSVNKPAAVTKELLKRIAAGEDAQVISGALEFYWFDLKYKRPSDSSDSAPLSGEQKK